MNKIKVGDILVSKIGNGITIKIISINGALCEFAYLFHDEHERAISSTTTVIEKQFKLRTSYKLNQIWQDIND